MSMEALYSLAYGLISACFIYPPTEFINAGLTVQAILASVLGSEQQDFITYHMRRTTATLLCHSVLFSGYYLGMIFVNSDVNRSFIEPTTLSLWWNIYLIMSVLFLCASLSIAFWWSANNWSNHPLAQQLQLFAPAESTWRSIMSSINIEYRRIDKFTTGPTPGRRLIVTDSWLIRTSAYKVHVAKQTDAHLVVVGTDEHALSPETTTGVQYLSLDVAGLNIKPFRIRLNAMEYQDLRDKLRSPVMNVRNVIIHQTLSERFLDAFRNQVDANEVFRKSSDMILEQCIGCMVSISSVKLQRLCVEENNTMSDCQQCHCRPMWCVDCMGRWFASRQDQTRPETWLASRCPCPTCRATFCMLDVCRVT